MDTMLDSRFLGPHLSAGRIQLESRRKKDGYTHRMDRYSNQSRPPDTIPPAGTVSEHTPLEDDRSSDSEDSLLEPYSDVVSSMDEEEEEFVFGPEESTEISEPRPGTGSEVQSTLPERPPCSKRLFAPDPSAPTSKRISGKPRPSRKPPWYAHVAPAFQICMRFLRRRPPRFIIVATLISMLSGTALCHWGANTGTLSSTVPPLRRSLKPQQLHHPHSTIQQNWTLLDPAQRQWFMHSCLSASMVYAFMSVYS
jgi:hypothetical protein